MKDKMCQVDAAEGKAKIKKPRHRSPNFPCVSLQKAIERAKEIDDAYKRAEIPIAVVHEKLGYKRFSANAIQLLAALKAYGLIDISGDGNKRSVKISDRAQKILGGHPDRDKFLKEAALSPIIYREIWGKYQVDGLPTDEALSTYLKWERKFNQKSIEGFIADFRDTIAFARINPSDIIGTGGEANGANAASGAGNNKPPANTSAKIPTPTGATLPQDRCNMATDTFTLEEGPVVLQYPRALSQSSFEDFETWTQLQLRKIKRSIKGNVSSVEREPEE